MILGSLSTTKTGQNVEKTLALKIHPLVHPSVFHHMTNRHTKGTETLYNAVYICSAMEALVCQKETPTFLLEVS